MENTITGLQFIAMIKSGAANLKKHVKEVNDLNVFPVPDGDTGENMLLTLNGGLKELLKLDTVAAPTLEAASAALANGMLLGARGNSGVIFSQLFAGLKKGLQNKTTADVNDLIEAFSYAVERAYAAVSNPVEGTILTVARESFEGAKAYLGKDVALVDFFKAILIACKKSLDNTINLLPALKEAGVIDSGGAGLYYFLQGAASVIFGEETNFDVEKELALTLDRAKTANELDFSKFTKDSVMEYGYCTECLLQLQTAKTDVEAFSEQVIVDYLKTIGDSIVAFKTETIIKLHVHTLTPHKVLEFCQQFGEFLTIKIENMTLQHNGLGNDEAENETAVGYDATAVSSQSIDQSSPEKRFALVTVAQGKGLTEVFKDLGADVVINGGQTNNPSVEDFLAAFDKCNAQEIFVLPNNSNIIMAAENAISIYKGKAHLIKTKNIGQAYSILSSLDYSCDDGQAIAEQMRESLDDTITASITTAVRDASLNGVEIKQGDFIGFTDKTMLYSSADKLDTLKGVLLKLNLQDKYFLIAVYGQSITAEEKAKTRQMIEDSYEDLEFYEINGGQDVYDYILIIE